MRSRRTPTVAAGKRDGAANRAGLGAVFATIGPAELDATGEGPGVGEGFGAGTEGGADGAGSLVDRSPQPVIASEIRAQNPSVQRLTRGSVLEL
jgi:hypothetical protein